MTTGSRIHGFGIGLRGPHFDDVRAGRADADVEWYEVITENFLQPSPAAWRTLESVRRDRPVVLHGVGLDIGGTAPLSASYLAAVRDLAANLDAPHISDHLSACRIAGAYVHELLPLPFTEEVVEHVAARARAAQDAIGRPLLLENPSTYVRFAGTQLSEWEFVAAVAERAGCGILLDVNNAYVNGANHGDDPRTFIDRLPLARVGQIHLAGHHDMGTHLLDTHGAPVCEAVWDLFARVARRLHPEVPIMIEWDENIPPLSRLLAELARAREVARSARLAAGPRWPARDDHWREPSDGSAPPAALVPA